MFLFPSSKLPAHEMQNPPLPADYVSYLSVPEYLAREVSAQKGFTVVRSGDAVGVAWKYGPFRFERYVGDIEPLYDNDGLFRLVTWQRIASTAVPNWWKPSRFVMHTSRTGYATVDSDPEYYKKWSSHAQRHRKQWLKQNWDIVPISIDEYLSAYKRSKMDAFLKFLFSSQLKYKAKGNGNLLHIVGAKRKEPHSQTEAGFVFIDVPETKQSIHLMSFHTDDAKKVSAGTGLMDYWFQHASRTGIRYLEFGCFWTLGEANSWKGFSQFKSQFSPTFRDYPAPLARWMGSKGRLLH